LTMYREVLGTEHPRVASNATGLGYWLIQEGEYGEAEQLLDEAVAIRRKALGDSHPQLASSLTAKANLLLATERFSEARDVAKQARGILADNLPEDHWRIAAAATVEGAALTRLGAYADAEPLLLGSIKPLSQAPIPGIAEQNQQRLADMYTAWKRPAEALKYGR
jgi:tetratricopeptide (TPR) repeat protein